ncbi:MAG TPA: glutathione synthase, partial [Hyphomonadaceae bacterium]|nr:glutathione synthase [Hyphomonadaceae bacterium]
MSLRIAVQMDPMETVDINADTTFAMAEAAESRGYQVWTYHPNDLSCLDGRLYAKARRTKVQRVPGTPALFEDYERLDLEDDVDVVLMRQDPPFD